MKLNTIKNRRQMDAMSRLAAASRAVVEKMESRVMMTSVTVAGWSFTGTDVDSNASPHTASLTTGATGTVTTTNLNTYNHTIVGGSPTSTNTGTVVATNNQIAGTATLSAIGFNEDGNIPYADVTTTAGTLTPSFSEATWRLRGESGTWPVLSDTWDGTNATITIAGNHDFQLGDQIVVAGGNATNGLTAYNLGTYAGSNSANTGPVLLSATYSSGTGNTTLVYSQPGTAMSTTTAGLTVQDASWSNGFAGDAPQYTQGAEIDLNLQSFTQLGNLTFDWYATSSGPKNMMVQYNTNAAGGGTWVNDLASPLAATSGDYGDGTGTAKSSTPTVTVDLSGVSLTPADQTGTATFGIRLVSAYDPAYPGTYSAANSPALVNGVVSQAPMGNSGNWRLDNIAVTGSVATPLITTNPSATAGVGLDSGNSVTFTAAANLDGLPVGTTWNTTPVVWQVSTDGGQTWINDASAQTTNPSATDYVTTTSSGSTTRTTTLTVIATAGNNGNQYRAQFVDNVGISNTTAAPVELNTGVSVSTSPTNAYYTNESGAVTGQLFDPSIGIFGNNIPAATFTAVASGEPAPAVTWEVNTGSGFAPDTNIYNATTNPAGDVVTTTTSLGVTTTTLKVPWINASPGTPGTAFATYEAVFSNTIDGVVQTPVPSGTAQLIELPTPLTATLNNSTNNPLYINGVNEAYAQAIDSWNFGSPDANGNIVPTADTLATATTAIKQSPVPSLALNGAGTATASTVGMGLYGTGDASTLVASDNASSDGFDGGGNEWKVVGGEGWNSNAAIGTQGAQFLGSTEGYSGIYAKFDIFVSAQGEGKFQVQYTSGGTSGWTNVPAADLNTDGDPGISVVDATNSTDTNIVHGGYFDVFAGGNGWTNGLSVNLSNIPAATNSPDFGIRIVNAATGVDCVNPIGDPLNNTSGNWTFDEVQITGSQITGAYATATVDPANYYASTSTPATFTATGNSSDGTTPTAQWQVLTPSANGIWVNDTTDVATQPNSNPGTSTLTVPISSNTGNQYRAVFTDGTSAITGTSHAAGLYTYVAPGVTPTAPANAFIASAGPASVATFTSTDTGTPAPTITWQINTGTGWGTDLNIYNATTNPTGGDIVTSSGKLRVALPSAGGSGVNGAQYRAVFTSTPSDGAASAPVTSAAATLNTLGTTITAWNFNNDTASTTIAPLTNFAPADSSGTGTAASLGMSAVSQGFLLGLPTAGNYTLTFTDSTGTYTTGNIAFNAPAVAAVGTPSVLSALQAAQTSGSVTIATNVSSLFTVSSYANGGFLIGFGTDSSATLTAATSVGLIYPVSNPQQAPIVLTPFANTTSGATGPDTSSVYATSLTAPTQSSDGTTGNYWTVQGSNGWNASAAIGTQGAQFLAPTTGYQNIIADFDINVSAYGEGLFEVQYTANGTTWSNVPAAELSVNGDKGIATATGSGTIVAGGYFDVTGGAGFYNGLTANISGISSAVNTAIANDANFGIRIVNAATGGSVVDASGRPLTSTKGSWSFDEVQITGTAKPASSIAFTGAPYTPIYSGNAATAAVAAVSEGGVADPGAAITYLYSGTSNGSIAYSSATPPTSAGAYTVTATFAGDTSYLGNSVSTSFNISKYTPGLVANDAGGLFSGATFPASATLTGVSGSPSSSLEGTSPTFTYYQGTGTGGTNLGSTAPSPAGTYTVVADFATTNDYAAVTSAGATFSIGSETVTVTSNTSKTYDGNPYVATATVSGAHGTDNGATITYSYAGTSGGVAYGPTATAPTAAGSYTVTASFAGDSTYPASAASSAFAFTIGVATPSITVSAPGGTYNSTPYAATAQVAGNDGTLGTSLEGVTPSITYYTGSNGTSGSPLGSTAPTNVGTYTAVATFGGSVDYSSVTAMKVFAIGFATPIISVTDAGGTGNGATTFPATATLTGVSGSPTASLDGVTPTLTYYAGTGTSGTNLGATAPSAAGNYTVVASFIGSTNYNAVTSGQAYFNISGTTTGVITAWNFNNLPVNKAVDFSPTPSTGTGTALSLGMSANPSAVVNVGTQTSGTFSLTLTDSSGTYTASSIPFGVTTAAILTAIKGAVNSSSATDPNAASFTDTSPVATNFSVALIGDPSAVLTGSAGTLTTPANFFVQTDSNTNTATGVTGPDLSAADSPTAGSSDGTSGSDWKIVGNNGWNTASPFGTQGAQFLVPTAGYTNLGLTFDWGVASQKANGQLAVEYTTNGGTGWNVLPASDLSVPSGDTMTTIENNNTMADGTGTQINSLIVNGGYFQNFNSGTWQDALSATFPGVSGGAGFGVRLVNAATGAAVVSGYPAVTPTAATASGTTVTLTVPNTGFGTYVVGTSVTIAGIAPAAYDGNYIITGVGSGNITYTDNNAGLGTTATSVAGSSLIIGPSQTSSNWRLDEVQISGTTSTIAPAVVTLNHPAGYTTAYTGIPATTTVTGSVTEGGVADPGAAVAYNYTGSSLAGVAYNSATAPTNAGNYTVTATFAGDSGGGPASASAPFTITPLSLSISTATVAGKPYDGTLTAAAPTINFTGLAAGETGTVTASGTGTFVNASAGSQTVNITGITLGGTSASNYTIATSTTTTATISKVTPTLSVVDAGGLTNGSQYAATATVAGINGLAAPTLEGIGTTFDYINTDTSTDLGSTAPSAAGHYTVTATFPGSTDYNSKTTGALAFTIGSETVTVTSGSNAYTGNPYVPVTTVAGSNGTDTGAASHLSYTFYQGTGVGGLNLGGTAPTDVGTYTVVAHFAGDATYSSAADSQPLTFQITQFTPTVTATAPAGFIFNGNPAATATATINGVGGTPIAGATATFVYTNTTTLATSSTAPTTAGTYSVVATYAGNTDYASVSSTNTATFTIANANPIVVVTAPTSLIAGSGLTATATVAGVTSADSTPAASLEAISPTFTYYTGTGTAGTNLGSVAPITAGTFTVVANFGGSTDYKSANSTSVTYTLVALNTITAWNFSNDTASATVNTAPAPLTGTGTASSMGMTTDLTGASGPYPITDNAAEGSLAEGPDTSIIEANSGNNAFATGGTTANEWKIVGKKSGGLGNGWNYDAPVGSQGAQFMVSTAGYSNITLTFDWGVSSGSANGQLAVEYTTDGGTSWNVAPSISLGANTNSAGKGDTAVETNTTATNPNIVNGEYFLDQNNSYGGAGLYQNGLSATFTSAAVNNPNFGVRLVNAATGAASVLSAAGTGLPSQTSGNWRFADVTISGLALPSSSVALNSPSYTQTYNGSPATAATATFTEGSTTLPLPAADITYTGINGTTYSSSATPPTNAGTYTVTATFAGDSNYAGSSSSASFTITPSASTISVTSASTEVFNTSAYSPSVSETGSSGAVTYSYTGTGITGSSTVAPTNVGSYSVTATVAADSNYATATSTAFAFTITPAASTINVTSASTQVFNTSAYSPTVSETGSSGAVTYSYTGTGITGSTTVAPINVGSYAVTATVAADSNYATASSTAFPFTITPAASTISVTSASTQVFNTSAYSPTVSETGSGGAVTYSYTGTGITGSTTVAPINVGSYAVTATVAADSNYATASSTAFPFTITPAASTISVTSATTQVFNNTAYTPSVSKTGSSGAVTYSYTGTGITGSTTIAPTNVGSYSVTATVAADTNYASATSAPFAFTITAASVAPTIANTAFSINSKALAGAPVGNIGATGSAGATLSYTLTAVTGTNVAAFKISSQGLISIAVPTDLPTISATANATFNVTVKDSLTGLSTTKLITITRTPALAMPPAFSASSLIINHFPVLATTAGTTIATVAATLEYTGQVVKYALSVGSGTPATSVTVNGATFTVGTTGIITTKNALPLGFNFNFNVIGTDGTSTATSTVAVTLNISQVTVVNTVPAWVLNDNAKDSPLVDVTVADATTSHSIKATITMDPTLGTLADPTTLAANVRYVETGTTGVYTMTGTAAQITTATKDLVYTPVAHKVASGSTYTVPITISVTDGAVTLGGTVTDSPVTTVTVTAINTAPTITGTPSSTAGAVASILATATATPFSNVAITDPDFGPIETVTVSLDNAVKGTLADSAAYLSSPAGSVSFSPTTKAGSYSVSGSPSAVTAALDALVYTPAQFEIAPNDTFVTTFTISTNDGLTTATNATTKVDVTEPADVAPIVSIGHATQSITDKTTLFKPFAGSSITDPDAGNTTLTTGVRTAQVETVTLTLSNPALGKLSGTGVVASSTHPGTYTITGTAAVVTTDLLGVVFTPNANVVLSGTPQVETIAVNVTDAAGGTATPGSTAITIKAAPRLTGITAALASTSLKGTIAQGTPVVTLKGTDLDASDVLTYSLVAGTGAQPSTGNVYFSIGGAANNQLLVSSTSGLTVGVGVYHVVVQVSDAGGDTVTQGLTITIGASVSTLVLSGSAIVTAG